MIVVSKEQEGAAVRRNHPCDYPTLRPPPVLPRWFPVAHEVVLAGVGQGYRRRRARLLGGDFFTPARWFIVVIGVVFRSRTLGASLRGGGAARDGLGSGGRVSSPGESVSLACDYYELSENWLA